MSRYTNKEGKSLPRCTQVIDILGYNKRALVNWASSKGKQADSISQEALNIGTLTHQLIEEHIYGVTDHDMSGFEFDAVVLATRGLDMYKDWEKDSIETYLESEYKIISESQQWGGTADAIAKMKDGTTALIDFKTSSGVFSDHIIQVSAYKSGIEEMGQYKIDCVYIVHVPKTIKPGTQICVKTHHVPEDKLILGMEIFSHALFLFNAQDKIDPRKW